MIKKLYILEIYRYKANGLLASQKGYWFLNAEGTLSRYLDYNNVAISKKRIRYNSGTGILSIK